VGKAAILHNGVITTALVMWWV